MKLIIGGFAQGKLHYVLTEHVQGEYLIVEEPGAGSAEAEKTVIFNHLHRYIKKQLAAGKDPGQELEEFVNFHPDCILICDEIGNGIVPMQAEEREYRETTGRILSKLAVRAESVERVICGIGQKLK